MKCPNCGREIPEGKLYCEQCGEDIHIVPDFEPELERSIEQNINNILEEMHSEEKDVTSGGPDEDVKVKHGKTRRWKLALIPVILAAAAWAAWGLYGYNSEEYQAERGARYAAAEKYDKAIACYSRALELDDGNIELMFSLAEVYFLKNNKIEYEYLLREIAGNPNASTEQLERAYGRLIAIYRARKDYQTINDLLLGSDNEKIVSTYQGYIARTPEFSIKEGYYTSIQPLKLTAFGTGKIYYTLDGTDPSEDSTQYTAPIILEKGDYVVTAYFVNDKGISSDIVSKEYHIEIDEIPAPDVSALSGEYHIPVDIEVSGEEGEIYYTMDGSDPTYSSSVYTGPIPMPLGKSSFKFAQIVNGVTGLVAERSYLLKLDANFGPEDAVAIVREYFMGAGKIYDEEGHFDDSGAMYQYEYQYVTNINDIDVFYVISEILCSSGGTRTKTGSNYAVNAYTGEYFRLDQNRWGDYTLVVMEQNPTQDSDNEE